MSPPKPNTWDLLTFLVHISHPTYYKQGLLSISHTLNKAKYWVMDGHKCSEIEDFALK